MARGSEKYEAYNASRIKSSTKASRRKKNTSTYKMEEAPF